MKCVFIAGLVFLMVAPLFAQFNGPIEQIHLSGHIKTRAYIIKRELPKVEGDTIDNWEEFNKAARRNLLNTGLFKEVRISGKPNPNEVFITVKESLFFLPIPFIDLADRNFNEWWFTHDHQWNRLNFGLDLRHVNLSGRRDKLRLVGQWGLIQKFILAYDLPFIDQELTFQPFFEFLYSRQREIPFITEENKQRWFRDEGRTLFSRFRGKGGLRYRPGNNKTYTLELGYFYNEVDPSLLELNPYFLGEGQLKQQYFQSRLIYDAEFRDRQIYPLDGYKLNAALTINTLSNSLNNGYITSEVGYWHRWNTAVSTGFQALGRAFIYGRTLPFYQARALGYHDRQVRSYEYFVVDGSDYILGKADLKINWVDHTFNWGKLMFIPALRNMPFELYTNLYFDGGRVHAWERSEANFLDESWLLGYGVGIDMLFYQNFLVRVQYSMGIHDNRGLFIHFSTNY